jgi:hypothetical protein
MPKVTMTELERLQLEQSELIAMIAADLGPPHTVSYSGAAYFECPFCGSPKFHVRPVAPRTKTRYSCWSCDQFGDAHDWQLWRKEQYGDHGGKRTPPTGHRPGVGQKTEELPLASDWVKEQSPTYVRQYLGGLASIATMVIDQLVSGKEADPTTLSNLRAMLRDLAGMKPEPATDPDDWINNLWTEEIVHMEECRDPDCDYACCRALKGLPPLKG